MESTIPDGRHSHGDVRRWISSALSENEQFEQYTFQPISDIYYLGAEYYTQPSLPQGHDAIPTDALKNPSSTPQPIQEPPTQLERRRRHWSLWTWEIANCCLLLVSLFAILATLYTHDGQPLPQWPFSITINALLSIDAVVMKASMLLILASGIGQLQWSWFLHPRPLEDVARYHEAAKGPLGSLSWLYRHHIHQPLTAFAAAIVIAAVAVDPFIQQLVKPADCKQFENEGPPASIPRTNYLSDDVNSFPSDLLGSLASGYYTPQNLSDFTCGAVTPRRNVFGIGKIPRRLDTSAPRNTINSISLGNDMGMIFPKSDVSLTPYGPNGGGNRTGCGNAASNNTWWCRQWGAATCSLQPCVRSYTANVDGGRLTETLNFLGVVDTKCVNDVERKELIAAGYPVDSNTRWLPYNLTFNPLIGTPTGAAFPESLLAHECLYSLDASFNDDIWTYILNQFIIGVVQREYPDGGLRPSYLGPTQLLSLFDLAHVNEVTINDAMSKLADAMTLWIHTHGYASHSERVVGQEYHYAICVKVNWDWVALPAVLTGLTLIFFLITVISTYRQRLPV
ncbi:hypothetical protein F5B21DRAFT_521189 [Xylaria acuta]|nr:hypothetical protein F5B21DRAFT_521189 [Xylaria acuta]